MTVFNARLRHIVTRSTSHLDRKGDETGGRAPQLRMVPPRVSMNQSLASSVVTRWNLPIRLDLPFLLETLSPGLLRQMVKSIPKIPVEVSYLIPRSICSSIPNPKLPEEYNK